MAKKNTKNNNKKKNNSNSLLKSKLEQINNYKFTYSLVIEIISFLLIILLILTVFGYSIAITYGKVALRNLSNCLNAFGILSIIVYFLGKVKKFKFSKLEKFIFVLAILTTLSLVDAINIKLALYGSETRGEGYFTLMAYYSYALLCTNLKKDVFKKVVIYSILLVGFCNLFYGLMQTGIIKQNLITILNSWTYSKGFNGNSMYCASLLSICYPIIMGLFIKSDNKKASIIFLILLIIFNMGVLNTGSMALFLSSIIILFLVLIQLIVDIVKNKNKNNKVKILKYICIVLTFVITTIFFQHINSSLNRDVKELASQTKDVTIKSKVDESYGTGRIHIWKKTLPKIKENWLFGIGVDNYAMAFNPPVIDVVSKAVVTKAHNEYLQKALCEGVASAIMYIIFLLVIFFKSINTKNKYIYGLVLGFTCYSIQAFFGISVTRVSPIYFIVIGLLIGKIIEDKKSI